MKRAHKIKPMIEKSTTIVALLRDDDKMNECEGRKSRLTKTFRKYCYNATKQQRILGWFLVKRNRGWECISTNRDSETSKLVKIQVAQRWSMRIKFEVSIESIRVNIGYASQWIIKYWKSVYLTSLFDKLFSKALCLSNRALKTTCMFRFDSVRKN